MAQMFLYLLLVLSGAQSAVQEGTASGSCNDSPSFGLALSIKVNRRLNQTDGSFYSRVTAHKTDSDPNDIELETTHIKELCKGKYSTRIEVVVKETSENKTSEPLKGERDRLLFHPKHGTNVVIINNRRSALKLDDDVAEDSILFTHRPLQSGEMFEVRMDKRIKKTGNCLAIGVTTHSPVGMTLPASMHRKSNGTWMYHNNGIYGSSTQLRQNYGVNLNTLQARDRIGVVRREDGNVHFYVNGMDQGRAAENVPEPVYGVFELWHDAIQGTIVH